MPTNHHSRKDFSDRDDYTFFSCTTWLICTTVLVLSLNINEENVWIKFVGSAWLVMSVMIMGSELWAFVSPASKQEKTLISLMLPLHVLGFSLMFIVDMDGLWLGTMFLGAFCVPVVMTAISTKRFIRSLRSDTH